MEGPTGGFQACGRAAVHGSDPPYGSSDLSTVRLPGLPSPDQPKWELAVLAPWGLIDFDCFFYWPSQEYDEEVNVEVIGQWAYLHE